MADALVMENDRNGCYPDRPATRTMNLQACAHTLDQSHQLFSLN